ncbi:MAG: FHA domain-containing protein [Lachnospiraceae bacterium]|nr:FHA domain-containing protein [Lachnospiraceae bacterium]
MEQIVYTFQKLKDNFLAASSVVLDLRHVFINETTKEVLFIYLPLEQAAQETDIFAFMESIIYSAISAQEEDMDYISRFVYFIKSLSVYEGEKIERFISSEDKTVVSTIKRHDARKSSSVTGKATAHNEKYDSGKTEATRLLDHEEATGLLDHEKATGLLDHEEATGLLDHEKATGLLDQEEATGLLDHEEATGLLDQEEATGLLDHEEATGLLDHEEATTLLQEEVDRNVSLCRLRTYEVILINKSVFRIGKESRYVDYVVRDNDKVSRSHADIITRGNRYFIMDLNSTNGTYINGRQIPARQEVEIFNDDCLKLANEEFEFRI